MIDKEYFAHSMAYDCDIIIHLFSKFSPEGYDYRPSPGQRSTLELLRYLSICAIAGIRSMSENNWELFAGYRERAKDMAASEFPAAMERQKQEIFEFFGSVSDETLRTGETSMPGGGGMMLPLGTAILNGPAKWLAAYKMQLFLYAKAAGASGIKTSNVWQGVDPKPAAAPVAMASA
jgi:hypothetical protein